MNQFLNRGCTFCETFFLNLTEKSCRNIIHLMERCVLEILNGKFDKLKVIHPTAVDFSWNWDNTFRFRFGAEITYYVFIFLYMVDVGSIKCKAIMMDVMQCHETYLSLQCFSSKSQTIILLISLSYTRKRRTLIQVLPAPNAYTSAPTIRRFSADIGDYLLTAKSTGCLLKCGVRIWGRKYLNECTFFSGVR